MSPVFPKLFALLIGVDKYSQVPLPDGSYYPHLGGCVRDVNLVEQMLKNRLNLPDEQIIKLLSEKSVSNPNAERIPTYENLVKAFKEILNLAQTGDQIYIHYSGHGGRSLTIFPEIKGKNGLDESLVPCDIGENGVCYFRDLEMSYLLKKISDKGVFVTLVLDSCHSGGATRGEGGAAARGIESIDTREQTEKSLVVENVDELKAVLEEFPPAATRNLNAAQSWRLPIPPNLVFISACRANELANEFAFDGSQRNGALTYWMLDALRQTDENYTYKMLYNRVSAKVHAKFVNQTPVIEGDRDRIVFGGLKSASGEAVNVTKVDLANNRITLNTGLFQGVSKGAQFAIFAAETVEFTDVSKRLAIAEIENIGTTESTALIVSGEAKDKIVEGSQAILLGVGIRLRGRIRLVFKENEFDANLKKLGDLIGQNEGDLAARDKWIRLCQDGEEADFQVVANQFGEFEIWDAEGRVLPNLRPALKAENEESLAKMQERLVQLTKYRNVRLIDNTDPASPLANKLKAELLIVKTDKDGVETTHPLAVPPRPLSVGEQACLRVTNLSNTPLNFVILDLSPDWGISQIHPDPNAQDYDFLNSGGNFEFKMDAFLPSDDYQSGTDILKVFATVEGTSFRWLQMSPLDQPPMPVQRNGEVNDDLEQLLTGFSEENMRNMKPVVNLNAPKGRSWTTAEIAVTVRRPTIAHVADPALSLLQSAVEQVVLRNNAEQKTRSINGNEHTYLRPESDDQLINEVAQYCVALNENRITEKELKTQDAAAYSDGQERGIFDTTEYCGGLMVGMAREWFNKVWGDDAKYNEYKEALNVKFGGCDTKYKDSALQYLEYLKNGGHTPYRTANNLMDFVVDNRLSEDATIGIVADWATGEPSALEVLRQMKTHNPNVAIHLGDIYYAGTEFEVENYFYQPWKNILELETSGRISFALPGNHDLYAGGKPFYDLLDKLQVLNKLNDRMASYFCLRNKYWQFIGLDTALHDRLGAGPTYLEPDELKWLKDKIENNGDRKTVLLSHHQLFSANDQWKDNEFNPELLRQLDPVLEKVDLWLWGHEHDLVIFEPFLKLKRGRCIGGSAFPVGNYEMPATVKNLNVKFNKTVALSKGKVFFQHCYTMIKLNGENATVSYYEDRDGGRLLFEETL